MKKSKYIYSLVWSLVISNLFAQDIENKSGLIDSIIAVVNDGVVLRSQLETQIKIIKERATKDGFELPEESVMEEQILEQLILEEIQLQRAERMGVQVSDQMLNSAISLIAEQNNTSFEKLPELLLKDEVDYGDFRRDLRKELILEQLREIDVIGRINSSERELNQCLEVVENNIVNNSEYNLSHILISVPDSATAEQYNEAQSEASNVINELKMGAEFGEMAITYSDSETGINRGLLGWRSGNQLPTLFANVIGSIKQGEFSQPIQSVSGFHIIKINDIKQEIIHTVKNNHAS